MHESLMEFFIRFHSIKVNYKNSKERILFMKYQRLKIKIKQKYSTLEGEK